MPPLNIPSLLHHLSPFFISGSLCLGARKGMEAKQHRSSILWLFFLAQATKGSSRCCGLLSGCVCLGGGEYFLCGCQMPFSPPEHEALSLLGEGENRSQVPTSNSQCHTLQEWCSHIHIHVCTRVPVCMCTHKHTCLGAAWPTVQLQLMYSSPFGTASGHPPHPCSSQPP